MASPTTDDPSETRSFLTLIPLQSDTQSLKGKQMEWCFDTLHLQQWTQGLGLWLQFTEGHSYNGICVSFIVFWGAFDQPNTKCVSNFWSPSLIGFSECVAGLQLGVKWQESFLKSKSGGKTKANYTLCRYVRLMGTDSTVKPPGDASCEVGITKGLKTVLTPESTSLLIQCRSNPSLILSPKLEIKIKNYEFFRCDWIETL
jgi:hypothetical protein